MTSTSNANFFDTKIEYIPTDKTSARDFLAWKYDAPSELYNYKPENFNEDLAYHLDPKNNIHSMVRDGKLIAYCSFGKDAQVPGGDYSEDAIDIGLMIKPELTGQGLGTGFVANIIDHAIKTYKPSKLRVTILDTNLRAKRVWEKNGFQENQSFERASDKTTFVVFTLEI